MSEGLATATRDYVTTKEECEKNIKGVCEGCGGILTAIETVDNSGRPTFWQGCETCHCFRSGVERKYFDIARTLVERSELRPYGHMSPADYEGSPERWAYYLDSQTAGLSHTIKRIHHLLADSNQKQIEQLRAALKVAKDMIRFNVADLYTDEAAWERFQDNSPKMRQINAALISGESNA